MIWIFNMEKASAGVCDNYHDAFQYLTEIENLKEFQGDQIHTELFDMSFEESLPCKKNWCIEFCKAHSYTLIESPQIIDSTVPQWSPKVQEFNVEDLLERAS